MGIYAIDIVGTCNLKCPSCARRENNVSAGPTYKGLMDFDLFVRVLDKIEQNRPGERHRISLFVWGEPLMHNRIGDIVAEINRRGWDALISTNGNAPKHLEAAILAKPAVFSVSLSGFERTTYNATHYKGEVETVISTIFLAWNLIKRHSPATDFNIHYHIYKDNGGENLATLQRILKALDCGHSVSIAQLLSLDDVLDDIKGKGNIASETVKVLPKLIISMKQWKELTVEYNDGKCEQIEQDRVVINADGSVQLCCNVFGDQYKLFPSYLDTTEAAIFAARDQSTVCGPCMEAGIPYVGKAIEHSAAVRKIVVDQLAANGGDKYLGFHNFGLSHKLMVRGLVGRRLKNAAKRRLKAVRRRLPFQRPSGFQSVAPRS